MFEKMIKVNKFSLLLMFIIVVLFVFSGISIKNTVLALSGNYNKNIGESLNTTDWNNLDIDFVAKSGDTMEGNLNMGNNSITGLSDPINDGDSVNKGFMDAALSAIETSGSANIENISGENLKMVCGMTPIGSTVWSNGGTNTITTEVNTVEAGFTTSNVVYLVSLFGDVGVFNAVGVNNIYKPNSGTYQNGFRVYIINNDLTMYNAASATSPWNWHLRWCGIGK